MRFARWILQALSASALVAAAASSDEKPAAAANAEPDIQATAQFAESNVFGHVFNGERNWMSVIVENKSDLNVSLTTVSGSFQNADTGAVLKNTTAMPYPVALGSGSKITIPYAFHSELRPNDVRLKIWVEYGVNDKKYRAHAYDSIVKIVEPAGSFFDFQMLTTYLMVAAILGGGAYAAYTSLVPQPKKKKSTRVPPISSPVEVTATGAGGYQEEWIPAHHMKKKAGESAASGTESGTDSGVQRRKSKGKRA